ncbi:MAG TPA: putative quinol monooxygenase [Syntrophales bacterium]|nr:putative quinol monooxygenase [Syntrophales bacterium]
MIYVIATIEVVEGKREPYLEEIGKILPDVRAEKGCIEYVPVIDLPAQFSAQEPVRGDRVTIIEKWETLEDLKSHMEAPHMKKYRERARKYIVSSRVQIFTSPKPGRHPDPAV